MWCKLWFFFFFSNFIWFLNFSPPHFGFWVTRRQIYIAGALCNPGLPTFPCYLNFLVFLGLVLFTSILPYHFLPNRPNINSFKKNFLYRTNNFAWILAPEALSRSLFILFLLLLLLFFLKCAALYVCPGFCWIWAYWPCVVVLIFRACSSCSDFFRPSYIFVLFPIYFDFSFPKRPRVLSHFDIYSWPRQKTDVLVLWMCDLMRAEAETH